MKQLIFKNFFLLNNILYISKLKVGSILLINFEIKGILTQFKGICIGLKKKSLNNMVTLCILRNIIDRIGIEFTFKLYNKSNLKLQLQTYEQKRFNYKSSKIYYLRNKLNQASLIKR